MAFKSYDGRVLTLVIVAPGLLKIKEFLEIVKQKQQMQVRNLL